MLTEEAQEIYDVAHRKYSNIAVIVSVYTLRIVWVDAEFAHRLEYTQDEMLGMPAVEITDLKPTDALKEATRLFTTHGEESKPVITKSGKALYMHTDVHAFIHNKEAFVVAANMKFDIESTQK